MLAEIITIGDEILIGQTIDTNSAFISIQLNQIGISVVQITSVPDNISHITEAFTNAENRASVIIITGGLGPTKDDITKQALCSFFNTKTVFSSEVMKQVEFLFTSRGLKMPETNKEQAMIPENCVPLKNSYGTAPGMWFEKNGKVFVSLPGVPYEMKNLMEEEIVPRLKAKFKTPYILHETVLTQGIGESFLMEIISEWEESLIKENIKLAYLPEFGKVKLRLSQTGENFSELKEKAERKINELIKLISEYYYGRNEEKLEEVIGKLLKDKKMTLATAESCTGGYIAHLITSVAGSSEYYLGSVVAYSNMIKEEQLNVSKSLLDSEGAVSKPIVEQMAIGVQKKFNSDFAIATSGIAGPAGGTEEKPVGTVWIAIAYRDGVFSQKHLFGKNREKNIKQSSVTALNMLRKILLDY
jgi:nicotinamide-nucleotide amidase